METPIDAVPEPTGPLETRDVFVDTEVYRRSGFDLDKAVFASLFEQIREGRLRLHIADITLWEIRRQMAQQIDELVRTISGGRRAMAGLRHVAPLAMSAHPAGSDRIDAERATEELFNSFSAQLRRYGANIHAASSAPGTEIFQAYFRREPPFDGKNAKEFPDAFVIHRLAGYCAAHGASMYVVSADAAMRRAAARDERLRPVSTIEALLKIATIEHSPDVEAVVGGLLATPTFEAELTGVVDELLPVLVVSYVGDLPEGETLGFARSGDPQNRDWTVISAGPGGFGVIVTVEVQLLVKVGFEDCSSASYDREDDVFFGVEPAHTEFDEEVEIRMFVRLDGQAGLSGAEMLTAEVEVSGPSEFGW